MLDLPVELILSIIAYLPVSSISYLSLVSRSWHRFISAHGGSIYHKAAHLHGFARPREILLAEAIKQYSERSIGTISTWKDLCRRRYCIEKSWSGQGPAQITCHDGTGNYVHRIKVDEKAGYILTTSSLGGLLVTDLKTSVELWSLPDSHVHPYAHCEYEEGFVIFDNIDGSKEVWRRVVDYDEDEANSVVRESLPCPRQKRVFLAASFRYKTATAVSTRGHFRPWAVLRPPRITRAFRLSYPYLGAAAMDSIYLWDIRTGALVQTIDTRLGQGNDPTNQEVLGEINYIEVSEKYVFLCSINSLRAFSRQTGRSVLNISSSQMPLAAWFFSISPRRWFYSRRWNSCLIEETLVSSFVPFEESRIIDEFVAVHISPCGSHLAVLMHSSKLLIIRNFEKAFQSNVPVYELSMQIQLGSPCYSSRYLAFVNMRIGVATRTGVFIIEPDWSQTPSLDSNSPPPYLRLLRAPQFGDRSSLGGISCLQMTDTGLFLNLDVHSLRGNDNLLNLEHIFYDSVEDQPIYNRRANGDEEVDVDSEELDDDPDTSVVVSIDFVSDQTV